MKRRKTYTKPYEKMKRWIEGNENQIIYILREKIMNDEKEWKENGI